MMWEINVTVDMTEDEWENLSEEIRSVVTRHGFLLLPINVFDMEAYARTEEDKKLITVMYDAIGISADYVSVRVLHY